MKIKNEKRNRGFTILETVIAVSLFLVISTIGMSSLLNANLLHKKSQSMRSILDNLSFIMDDMSRNLRTGYTYHCLTNVADLSGLTNRLSCATGGGIGFEETHGNSTNNADQWVYKIQSSAIWKSIDSGTTWVQLNPPEVVVNSVSGFSVLGAEAPASDTQQPLVIIRLVGTITYNNIATPFSIETTVSQRLIDQQ